MKLYIVICVLKRRRENEMCLIWGGRGRGKREGGGEGEREGFTCVCGGRT